ncbi:YobA family protein [Alkalihalobacillus sp. AL-G]|uniref:YobA family protein n=1 Tax=Alkalihalobacillus sp. AL-G TaxID=2926399 RepID=UPI00272A6FCA|nr:YobA family protein [Alkalihalobacillus sp. AL-G]WLD92940.1 YobA family protein [Alkalihalobacillus sp. AL-G]
MKKWFYWSIILAFILIMPGCGGSDTLPLVRNDVSGDNLSEQSIKGYISAINAPQILVLEDITKEQLEDFDPNDLSTYHGGAFWIKVKTPDSFKIGQKVEVWTVGPILESYPAQAEAGKVEILEDVD